MFKTLFHEDINAFEKLFSYMANKKYGIVDNEITKEVIYEANLRISKSLDESPYSDLFEETDRDKLLEYENLLSDKVTRFVNQKIIVNNREFSDEINLLKNAHVFSLEKLRNYSISLALNLPDKVKQIEKINLNDFLANAKTLFHIDGDLPGGVSLGDYLLTSEFEVGSQRTIGLLHLGHASGQADHLVIHSIFICRYDDFKYLLNNPAHLFLKMIDRYGLDMEIGKVVKRFFLSITVSKNNINSPYQAFNFINPKSNQFYAVSSLLHTSLAVYYNFTYTVNLTLWLRDIKDY